MADDEKSEKRLPPYVSYKTWGKLLHGLVNFLPDVIDSSVYSRMGFSGTDTKRLRTTLRYLNLMDEKGKPDSKLNALIKAYGDKPETKSQVLTEIMRGAYPLLSSEDFNLASATWKQLTDKFESLGTTGEVQRLAISFFLHMAADAGLELSPHLSDRTKTGYGRPNIVKRTRQKHQEASKAQVATRVPESTASQKGATENIGGLDLDPSVAGILHLIPRKGEKWDKASRDRFKAALAAVLDAVYPDGDGS